jgi:hypothetical protein
LYLVLIALGFDTILVRSNFMPGQCNSNLIPVVRLEPTASTSTQEKEQLYMLDVASAQPIEVPIPLHQLPHRRQAGGHWYEYRKHVLPGREESTHGRYQIGGSWFDPSSVSAPDSEKEVLIFEFDLAPRTLDYFPNARDMFVRPEMSPNFLKRPFLFRYLRLEGMEPDGSDNELVLVIGLRIVIATTTKRVVTEYKSYDELAIVKKVN